MTKETDSRGHYDALNKLTGEWKGLEGIANNLIGDNAEKQFKAREKLKVSGGFGTDVPDYVLRDNAVAKGLEAKTDALQYFEKNQKAILGEIPESKLEKAVSDILPQIGFEPDTNAKGKFGEASKRHDAYLNTLDLIKRYSEGKVSDEEKREILEIAENFAGDEEADRLDKKGYSREKDAELYALSMAAKAEAIHYLKDRSKMQGYLTGAVKYMRKQFEDGFNDEYSAKDYATDLIKSSAKKDAEKTIVGLANLNAIEFK